MKIAVYTIAKNEEQYVNKWFKSSQDADYHLIADTGSIDKTLEYCHSLMIPTIDICVNPWRFDDARNASLIALPSDIDVCIALDMDEVLTDGWREKVEKAFLENPSTDRLRYNYVWSWNDDNTPGLTYYGDKIHVRKGYRWIGPVHETLNKDKRWSQEIQTYIEDTLIEHYPDSSKPRNALYLDLLRLATLEDPHNDRNAHYYARDLLFAHRFPEALLEFQRHLDLPTARWKDERATSLKYMGDCLWALNKPLEALPYFKRAIVEAPYLRENYIALAQAYKHFGLNTEVIRLCEQALAIKERSKTYLSQAWAWGPWPQQMLDEARQNIRDCIDGKSTST